MSFITTKFQEILSSGFRGVALTRETVVSFNLAKFLSSKWAEEQRYLARLKSMVKKKFDIDLYEVKGQGHTDFMNLSDASNNGDTLKCQTKYDYVEGQKKS